MSIATQIVVPVGETPAIVTVIIREEIQNPGARDLTDLLRMVPGSDFGVDVNNVIGIAVRGNWALEGKVLIAIDGHMMNETSYGSCSFGHYLLLASIQKIESIRAQLLLFMVALPDLGL